MHRLREEYLRVMKRSAVSLFVVYLLVTTFPGVYTPMAPGLDWSWIYALNHLANTNYVFGRDFVFTYGPLGFILVPLNVGSNLVYSLAFKLTVHAILGASLLYYIWRTRQVLTVCLFVAAYMLTDVMGLANELILYDYKILIVICMLIALSLKEGLTHYVAAPLAGILSSLLLFMKLSLGLADLLAIIVLSISLPKKNRRNRLSLIYIGSSYLGTTAVLALIFFRSPANFFNWLKGALSISDGYSAAMSSSGPSWVLLVAVACIVIYALVILLIYRMRSTIPYILLAFGVVIFFSFKNGFVRQDSHIVIFFTGVMSVLSVCILTADNGKELAIISGGFVLVSVLSVWPDMYVGVVHAEVLTGAIGQINIQTLASLNSVRDQLDVQTRSHLKDVLLPGEWVNLIKEKNSTVDVVPWEISYCPANDLRWLPGPTLQTYTAYTSFLDQWGAGHYAGATSPDFLIASFQEIDGRHPLWGAPATWRAILRNYQPVAGIPKLAIPMLLQKKAEVYNDDWSTVSHEEAYVNDWISVPATNNLLFADIDMSFNPLGLAAKNLFRVPPVSIDLMYASGKSLPYRIIPDTAADGLLMNYLPSTKEELESLFGNRSMDRVVKFKLSGPGTSFYGKKVSLTWRELAADLSFDQQFILDNWTGGFYGPEESKGEKWRWCGNQGQLLLTNNSTESRTVVIDAVVETGHEQASELVLSGDLFTTTLAVNSKGAHFSKEVTIPLGTHTIRFSCNGERVNAPQDPRYMVFRVINFRLMNAH